MLITNCGTTPYQSSSLLAYIAQQRSRRSLGQVFLRCLSLQRRDLFLHLACEMETKRWQILEMRDVFCKFRIFSVIETHQEEHQKGGPCDSTTNSWPVRDVSAHKLVLAQRFTLPK